RVWRWSGASWAASSEWKGPWIHLRAPLPQCSSILVLIPRSRLRERGECEGGATLEVPTRRQELTKTRAGRRPAELPQHQDDLAAVVRRVIQSMLDELAKDVGVFVHGTRRPELL